ncbi:MAG: hypothetical protein H6Q70_650 [Firmicutes bacterium]|nr:hypothetical protein [Bacillota bacterium]
MNRLDPNKLYVRLHPGVTPRKPIIFRHYTLTHSDDTGNLFLSVALEYDYSELTPMRDEVLAEWLYHENQYSFLVNLHVDSQPAKDLADSTFRYHIFKRELPLALEAIYYGDQVLFDLYPSLNSTPILIHFDSVYSTLCKTEYWGTFADYR